METGDQVAVRRADTSGYVSVGRVSLSFSVVQRIVDLSKEV